MTKLQRFCARMVRACTRTPALLALVPCLLLAACVQPAQPFATVSSRTAELERRLAGPDGSVMVVAHRGCWRETSENSLDAIEACIAAGVDMVELDVRATRDGQLVLLHDATLDRTTDGSGPLDQMDWAEVRKLHLRKGQGRGTPLTDRRVPTLEQALATARGRILINLDAKVDLTDQVLALIAKHGDMDQILFKAEAPLAEVLQHAPWVGEVNFQPILREPYLASDPQGYIAAYDPIRPVSYEIDVKTRAFTPVVAPLIRARCARFWVNSLSGRIYDDEQALTDPDHVWGALVAEGVDAIQTDYPLLLRTYLDKVQPTTFRCPLGG
ncbi:glycerophosphodiester phosphodiesterase [Aurantiacibacter xanthus]|uniref:Glycerophosphodiester phosphodiesterase n=1 Tax=Aurantiacibacter xanthus TaxID=1784712 RepID=A0A3A1P5K6_9SPHN|nr:glycerophosphodiester phosphodiesterase family protein [Aurantiacibacter xanthus]RIV82562.1 glycerophosphodiester phosphodiesterase [Aurantiacibacter xanthus]